MDTPRSNSAYMPPPPLSPGRRSTLLAICRQLPPSMQRAEWCLDDYIITDKLYKGYASMGEFGCHCAVLVSSCMACVLAASVMCVIAATHVLCLKYQAMIHAS